MDMLHFVEGKSLESLACTNLVYERFFIAQNAKQMFCIV